MASNSTSGIFGAFLGGAIVGAVTAIMLAPQPGRTLRERLRDKLSQHSVILSDAEVDELISRLEADDEEIF